MKVALLLWTCIIPLCLFAQPNPDTLWTRRIGGAQQDVARGVEVTPDGGYVVVGWTCSLGDANGDGYMVKLTGSGTQQWARLYGGNNVDNLFDVQCLPGGGYVAAGNTRSGISGILPDAWLIRTDTSGFSRWSQHYGDSLYNAVYSVRRTSDGNFIMAGYTGSGSSSSNDFYVVKADSGGNLRWTQVYGPAGREDVAYRVRQTPDGGYAVCGYAFINVYDFMLVRINAIGQQIWTQYYGTAAGIERAYDLDTTADHGFVMAGSGTDPQSVSTSHPFIVRADSAGHEVWRQLLPDTGSCYSVRALPDGSFIIAGDKLIAASGRYDFYLARLSAGGSLLWSRTYRGSDESYAYAVRSTPDGGYILCGYTLTGSDQDWFIVKTGPDHPEGITDRVTVVPSGFDLSAYPNPFNPTTTLSYVLPATAAVSLVVYDLSGREVQRVQQGIMTAGLHTAILNAGAWPSGVYFARLSSGALRKTQKILLIK